MTVILVLLLGTGLGWLGCYLIFVTEWKLKAWMAFDVAQAYAMCFFQSNAKKDCTECSGQGFTTGEVFLAPCKVCYAGATELIVGGRMIRINHDRLRDPEDKPQSD